MYEMYICTFIYIFLCRYFFIFCNKDLFHKTKSWIPSNFIGFRFIWSDYVIDYIDIVGSTESRNRKSGMVTFDW